MASAQPAVKVKLRSPFTSRIIALHGLDECGKGTIGDMIEQIAKEDSRTVAIAGFADLVKIGIARSFDANVPDDRAIEWYDELKVRGFVTAHKGDLDDEHRLTLDGRQFIRNYAEGLKPIFGNDCWVNALFERIGNAEVIILTDLRFFSEAKAVGARQGEIWEITGRGEGFNGDFHGEGLPNRIIDNSGSRWDTLLQVKELLAAEPMTWGWDH